MTSIVKQTFAFSSQLLCLCLLNSNAKAKKTLNTRVSYKLLAGLTTGKPTLLWWSSSTSYCIQGEQGRAPLTSTTGADWLGRCAWRSSDPALSTPWSGHLSSPCRPTPTTTWGTSFSKSCFWIGRRLVRDVLFQYIFFAFLAAAQRAELFTGSVT